MKRAHTVRVEIQIWTEVEMEVHAEEGEDPTDLTDAERARAVSRARAAGSDWDVYIESVTEVGPGLLADASVGGGK